MLRVCFFLHDFYAVYFGVFACVGGYGNSEKTKCSFYSAYFAVYRRYLCEIDVFAGNKHL